jgi:hypothetical protein
MTATRIHRRHVVLDRRGQGRALRVTWHHEASVAVISVWRDDRCSGTVQVAADDIPALIAVLAQGLAEGYGAERINQAS